MRPRLQKCVSKNGWILLANSNQWHFNNLVKKPCHETHCRCPHRLHLSFQSSRSCALPSIKVLKDKDLEFANSNHPFNVTLSRYEVFEKSMIGSALPSGCPSGLDSVTMALSCATLAMEPRHRGGTTTRGARHHDTRLDPPPSWMLLRKQRIYMNYFPL